MGHDHRFERANGPTIKAQVCGRSRSLEQGNMKEDHHSQGLKLSRRSKHKYRARLEEGKCTFR